MNILNDSNKGPFDFTFRILDIELFAFTLGKQEKHHSDFFSYRRRQVEISQVYVLCQTKALIMNELHH